MNCSTEEALRRVRERRARPGWPLSVGPCAASGIEAASAGETTKIGSTVGESPTAESGDAQKGEAGR
jgi:hypothetical protein